MRRHHALFDLEALGAEDAIILGTILLLPWFWGGVGLGAVRLASAAIAAAVVFAVARGAREEAPTRRRRLWLLPAVLLALWGGAQATPLPRSVVAWLSPRAAAIQSDAFGAAATDGDAWLRAEEARARAAVPEAPRAPLAADRLVPAPPAPDPPRAFRLSLLPSETVERTFWFVALLLAFSVVLARTAKDAAIRDTYESALFALGASLALVGVAHRLTGPGTLLWIRPVDSVLRPFGPYVNPNHFAGAMELLVPWMAGYAMDGVARAGRRVLAETKWALAATGAVFGFAGTILAASKTGAALVTLATCAVLALSGRSPRRRGVALAIAAACVAVAILAATVGGTLTTRVADYVGMTRGESDDADRATLWRAMVPMFEDFPVTGSGLGAFRAVFTAYLPRGESEGWLQAHSDWIELVLGGGLVALGLVLAQTVLYAIRVVRAIGASARSARPVAGLGAVLGVAAITLHAFVDFNHQIPANALLFVAVAAIAIAPAEAEGGDR